MFGNLAVLGRRNNRSGLPNAAFDDDDWYFEVFSVLHICR